MKNSIAHRHLGAIVVSLGALMQLGCAALEPSTPEQIVQQRASEYWKARTAGQAGKAYALSTPSYRQLRTEAQFTMQFGAYANVQSAEVAKVTCEAEKCTVKLKLEAKPPMMGVKMNAIHMYMDEIWLLENGRWWHYQEL